ncbi:MAG: 30S ribosomal protein S4 [candidate division WS1 bacterium]|nr:30S ribosomal protein S4 [candidate division WS1 bacterium]
MARYTGPVCRICRREGQKLFLKGERCHGPKCAIERKAYPPGEHGNSRRGRRRPSDFALQLREKQKLRSMYGLLERPFRRYVTRALGSKGVTGFVLLSLLERRLDSVLRRAGFASSQNQARQVVRHRHVTVNGQICDVPSRLVKPGDEIEVRENSRDLQAVNASLSRGYEVPGWLNVDTQAKAIVVDRLPEPDDMKVDVDEQQVVEFYSR